MRDFGSYYNRGEAYRDNVGQNNPGTKEYKSHDPTDTRSSLEWPSSQAERRMEAGRGPWESGHEELLVMGHRPSVWEMKCSQDRGWKQMPKNVCVKMVMRVNLMVPVLYHSKKRKSMK